MKRLAVRMVVVLTLVASGGAALYQAVLRSQAIEAAHERLARDAAAIARADAALAELGAAVRAYVAPGQGLDFWAGAVDEQLAKARHALEPLQASEALARLQDFEDMDRRARHYVRAGQRSMAADLIFADGFEIVAAARNQLAGAGTERRAALDTTLARDRRLYLAWLGGLAAIGLIASLLLLRGPAGEITTGLTPNAESVAPVSSISGADDSIGAALDASLEGLDLSIDTTQSTGSAAATSSSNTVPNLIHPPIAIDLPSAADVCVDLGRLLDARDLPVVLGRTAGVLGARGLVLWLADANGAALSPALAHGYAAAVVARMGSLTIDEDNATSAAYRTKTLQIVHGALAAPLLTAEGCSGVLAVELPDGRERASDVQALARIVAAQLASGVAAPAADARKTAEA